MVIMNDITTQLNIVSNNIHVHHSLEVVNASKYPGSK